MPNFDQVLMGLTIRLAHVARAYKSAADQLTADFGLSHAAAWPMVMIGRMGEGVRPGAVAEQLGLEPPSLVRVIDQLVSAGLVVRRDDPSDRRAKALYLTTTGKTRAAALEAALVPFRAKLFEKIDKADIAACARVLECLDDAIVRLDLIKAAAKPADTGLATLDA